MQSESSLLNKIIREISKTESFLELNNLLFQMTGIYDFFSSRMDIDSFLDTINNQEPNKKIKEKMEFGDFQTPISLTKLVCRKFNGQIEPSVLIEPTCGIGNFVISALQEFP